MVTKHRLSECNIRRNIAGAEPSPAYFNILMHGDEPEVLDGTQLAADWTFSGLQKFGQGLLDRLRGHKLPNKLLERVSYIGYVRRNMLTGLCLKISSLLVYDSCRRQFLMLKLQ